MEFTLDLVVTEQCNLQCSYCYMTNRNTYMEIDILEKTLELFKDRNISVTFFGGEPLLNFKIIERFIRLKDRYKNIKTVVLITNGILLDKNKYKFLTKNNISVSVSYDGLWNDKFQDYHTKIEKNLKECNIRGVKTIVSPKCSNYVENFKYLYEEVGVIPDFTITRDCTWEDDLIKKFIVEITSLREYLSNINRSSTDVLIFPGFFYLTIADIIFGKRKFMCGLCESRLAIFPNGDVYPCARFGSYRIGKISNVFDPDWNVKVSKNCEFFMKSDISNPYNLKDCEGCKLFNFCNGQCQFSMLLEGNFKTSKPVKSICILYEIIFKESFKLFLSLSSKKQKALISNIIRRSLI